MAALLFAFACSEDVPNPALPDINSIPEEPIKAFSLISPSSGASLNIKPGDQIVEIRWSAAEDADTYEWIADERDGDFSEPLLVIPSNNEGISTTLTLTYTQIYDALGDAGVAEGERANLKWTVRAKSGNVSRLATSPRYLDLQRGGVRFTVFVPENTPDNFDVYLAGQFGFLTGADWQQPGTNPNLKLTKNADGSHSIILGIPENQSFNFKFFIVQNGGPGSWSNGEQQPNGAGDGSEGMPDRSFTYTGVGDEFYFNVSFWEGFLYPYVVFRLEAPANTPTDRDVFVAGQWDALGVAPGAWQQPGTNPRLKMTRVNAQEYYFVVPEPANGTSVFYKYFISSTTAPTWDNGENGGDRNFVYDGTNNVVEDVVGSWGGI